MALNKGTIGISVIYPRTRDSTFDLDYYISSHMARAEKAWKSFGMIGWNVFEVPEGDVSIYAFVTFEAKGETGLDGVKAAMGSEEGKALVDDLPNFSNKEPQIIIGSVAASGAV